MCILRAFHERRGASAIEFALIAPAFLLIAFSLFDLGRLGLVSATLTHAAQHGARIAALHGPDSGQSITDAAIEAQVRSRIFAADSNAVDVTVLRSADQNAVTVVAGYTFVFLFGLMPVDPMVLNGRAALTIQ